MLTRVFEVARLSRPARLRRPCARTLSRSAAPKRQVSRSERKDYDDALQVAQDVTERVSGLGELLGSV